MTDPCMRRMQWTHRHDNLTEQSNDCCESDAQLHAALLTFGFWHHDSGFFPVLIFGEPNEQVVVGDSLQGLASFSGFKPGGKKPSVFNLLYRIFNINQMVHV